MNRAPPLLWPRFVWAPALSTLCTSCILFVNFDDRPGGSATDGGGGSGGPGGTGPGGSGAGGAVAYPCGGPKQKGDFDPGLPGVCEVEEFQLPPAFLTDDVVGLDTPRGRRVVLRGGSPSALFVYSEDLATYTNPLSVNPAADPSGALWGGSTLVYTPEVDLPDCQGPCFWFGESSPTLECSGRAVAGAAGLGDVFGVARANGKTYFLTEDTHQVFELQSCAPDPSTCTGAPLSCGASTSVMAMHRDGLPDPAPVARRLEFDGERLWWTTARGCVYSADPEDFPLPEVDCAVPRDEFTQVVAPNADGPVALRATRAGVFVATGVPNPADKGPIFRVNGAAQQATPIAASGARAPFAADDNLLYAIDDSTQQVLAIDRSGELYARTGTLEGAGFITFDASDPSFLYIATSTKLYRWRNPDPCTVSPPGECGDGCLDFDSDEECDDGNTDDGDKCSADCRVPPR